jgi:hypothetical protein
MMALGPRFGGRAKRPGGPARSDAGWRQHWLYRQFRGMRPDRNPLRRRTDRVETYLLVGLFAAALGTAPALVELASHATWQGALRVMHEQQATHVQVTAHLSQPAAPAGGAYALSPNVPAYATWTSATGIVRSGIVPAVGGSPKGTPVPVFIDQAGNLTTPPLTLAEVANEADAAGVGAAVGIVVVTMAGAAGLRQVLYRRRMAAWEADWAVTARTWNRQRG